MSQADLDTTPYCDKADVKDRLLIKSADTSYDTALDNAIIEASRTVDIFLKPYADVPLQYTIPDPVIIITADLSSSIFKRRLIPSEVKIRGAMQPDMINDIDGTGWFALALKKLLDYIKNYYALEETPDASNLMYNPEIFKELFVKGILTLKEARAYMGNASTAINEALNKVLTTTQTLVDTKTLTKTETNVLSDTESLNRIEDLTTTKTLATNETKNTIVVDSMTKLDTHRSYPTKKQRGFGFIKGNATSDNVGAGYTKESESA